MQSRSTFFSLAENAYITLLLKNTLLACSSLVDCTQELQAKCTGPHGSPPSTTMLSRKNSRWCRLATVIAPGSPKSESTMNSAVYTTCSPLLPLFWHQSLIDAWPLCIGFLVPGNDRRGTSRIKVRTRLRGKSQIRRHGKRLQLWLADHMARMERRGKHVPFSIAQ